MQPKELYHINEFGVATDATVEVIYDDKKVYCRLKYATDGDSWDYGWDLGKRGANEGCGGSSGCVSFELGREYRHDSFNEARTAALKYLLADKGIKCYAKGKILKLITDKINTLLNNISKTNTVMTTATDFKLVPLKEIKADPNQPRKYFNDAALKELTASVKDKGVLQPIMIRPNGKGYILVCGERRYRASTAAGLIEIPAVIRDLNDQEALEIQFIENIQRDDVHPMDEAVTFKGMLETKVKPYTIEDIAAKINKPASFVAQRLALNNLIPEMQKEFWDGKFLIGHAILFARLTPVDQKECFKQCREWNSKNYRSVSDTKKFIEEKIMMSLSSVPFKKDDATLDPKAGACNTCQKRSGCNKLLFDDIKQPDRCFDRHCYEGKMGAWMQREVERIITEHPEIKILSVSYGDRISAEFTKALKDMGIKIYSQEEYATSNYYHYTQKAKGFYLNGNSKGQTSTIYLKTDKAEAKKEASKKGDMSVVLAEEIAGIKQRVKRAAELDDEKVWRRIHDEILTDKKALINSNTLSKVDTAAILFAMYMKSGYSGCDKIAKIFGGGTKEALIGKMLIATPAQFNEASRIFILTNLNSATGSHSSNSGQYILKMVAEQYHKEKITSIEADQKVVKDKREGRAAIRIKALQEESKQAKTKEIKKAPTKAAKKK